MSAEILPVCSHCGGAVQFGQAAILEGKKVNPLPTGGQWLTPRAKIWIGIALVVASLALTAIPIFGQMPFFLSLGLFLEGLGLTGKITIATTSLVLWFGGDFIRKKGKKELKNLSQMVKT